MKEATGYILTSQTLPLEHSYLTDNLQLSGTEPEGHPIESSPLEHFKHIMLRSFRH